MDRVRISRRDTTDTGITAEPMVSSVHVVQSIFLSPGTEVGVGRPRTEVGRIPATKITDKCTYVLWKPM